MAQNTNPTTDKFGIPLNGAKLGILQPKMQYRFRVELFDFGDGGSTLALTQNVQSCTRPQIEYEPIEVHSYVSKSYYAGKHTWSEVNLVLRDDITNAVVSKVGQQVQKQLNHFEQTSTVAGVNYKFNMQIQMLDGTNNDELEVWVLEGCFLQGVKYGDVDYTVSDYVTVELTVRYDNATHIVGPNSNDGTTVGGDPFPNNPSGTGGTVIS